MQLRVRLLGAHKWDRGFPPREDSDFILRALSIASGSSIELTSSTKADLTVIYPYLFPFRSTFAGVVAETGWRRFEKYRVLDPEDVLRKLLQIPKSSRILFVAFENLDRRPWQMLGNLLLRSRLPRITSWPVTLDPFGFRVPYWWNYVDWPEIPRPRAEVWTRLGTLYGLDTLTRTRVLDDSWERRHARAIWVTKHLDSPRPAIRDQLEEWIEVDITADIPWGSKLSTLMQYRYCVVAENSPGYGYETEKVPDALAAGCVPVGYIQNPCSDFNPQLFEMSLPMSRNERMPALLTKPPSLDGLLDYLALHVL